jgi:flagellar hook-length control protein FliK
MTISPTDPTLAVLPSGPGASGASASAGSADAAPGDFLAAMLQAMASGQAADPPVEEASAEAPGDADTTEAPALDPTALGLAVVLPFPAPVEPVAPTTPVAPEPPDVAAVASGPAGVVVQAQVADATGGSPTGATDDIRTSVDATAGAAPEAAPAQGARASAAAPAAPSSEQGTPVLGAADHDLAQPDAAPGTSPSAAAPAGPQPTTADLSASVTAPSVTPSVTVPAASSGTDPVAPAEQVVRQVIPEVTSLVSRGNGTHRITLALKPEALGEVRVVMTVRDGAVHVQLAAGQEAQRALLEGSPELTRLLEQVGATDTRVVVRDLGQATTSGPSVGLGAGGTGPQDQHAGTRAQHPATDGTHDGGTGHSRAATGTKPSRSDEPVTRTRTAGVDVTM